MKIFKKIKIDEKLTSRTVLEVIDSAKADFRVIFIVRHHLEALEGENGSNSLQRKYVEL